MPTFTMDELRQSVGSLETVSGPSYINNIRPEIARVGQMKHRSLGETQTLIKSVMAEANRPMVRREVFRAIDRKNSPHMRKIIDDLVEVGELVKVADSTPSGTMPVYWYSLP